MISILFSFSSKTIPTTKAERLTRPSNLFNLGETSESSLKDASQHAPGRRAAPCSQQLCVAPSLPSWLKQEHFHYLKVSHRWVTLPALAKCTNVSC